MLISINTITDTRSDIPDISMFDGREHHSLYFLLNTYTNSNCYVFRRFMIRTVEESRLDDLIVSFMFNWDDKRDLGYCVLNITSALVFRAVVYWNEDLDWYCVTPNDADFQVSVISECILSISTLIMLFNSYLITFEDD